MMPIVKQVLTKFKRKVNWTPLKSFTKVLFNVRNEESLKKLLRLYEKQSVKGSKQIPEQYQSIRNDKQLTGFQFLKSSKL